MDWALGTDPCPRNHPAQFQQLVDRAGRTALNGEFRRRLPKRITRSARHWRACFLLMNPPTLGTVDLIRTTNSWPRLVDQFRRLCGYRFPRLGSVAFAAILKSLPSVIESRLFPGIKAALDLRDETQRTTYWFGTRFEEPTPQVLQEWSAGATCFFDIGSNYGFYSFLLYSSAPHLRIYPFEPNPASFQRMTEIQSRNCAALRSCRRIQ